MSEPVSGITEEMTDRAARVIAGGWKGPIPEDVWATRLDEDARAEYSARARVVLEAALSGRVPAPPEVNEFCRACRDERGEIVPAEFIIWGKYTPQEHLGPRCYPHTVDFVGSTHMSRIDQWAVFDLRPFRAAAREARRLGEQAEGEIEQADNWCNCQAIPGTANYPGPWHPKGDPDGCPRFGRNVSSPAVSGLSEEGNPT